MKKADFEVAFYQFIPKTKDLQMLIDMRKACQKRINELLSPLSIGDFFFLAGTLKDYEMEKNIKKEELKHEEAIKKLNPGSKVIVKYQDLAGEIVEIVKHNPKYTRIKRANGEIWNYPRRALGFVDSNEDKLTAKVNRDFKITLRGLGGIEKE